MGRFRARPAAAGLAFLCLTGALFLGTPLAHGNEAVAVRLTADQGAGSLALELDSANPLSTKTFFLTNRPRFVVDLPAQPVRLDAASPGGLAIALRHGQPDPLTTRVVVDMTAPAVLLSATRTATTSGWRTRFVLTAAGGAQNGSASEAAAYAPPAPKAHKIVVIDAGHGGRDSGALSPDGRREEKSLTLAAALALRDQLEGRGYKVVLTRDRDEFITLAQRVKIAREAKADLFISLHADSSDSRTARGATIYTLSASGRARARSLMDQQNWRVIDDGDGRANVDTILFDLARKETASRSTDFADMLASHLQPVTPLTEDSHRSAGFFVLLAPDVPAVLLEMGFMTNKHDVTRLGDAHARAAMMSAIADAIDEQFESRTARAYAEADIGGASFEAHGAP